MLLIRATQLLSRETMPRKYGIEGISYLQDTSSKV